MTYDEHVLAADIVQLRRRILQALETITQYGGIDGSHHKDWVLDQVVRTLTQDGYDDWVRQFNAGEEGPDTYAWEEGIAP